MKIVIETIPHSQHRYETVGDWWTDEDGTLQIRVSDLGDEKAEQLVAIHELVELLLCKARGVSEQAVDAFDKAFEEDRADGDDSEPGDAVDAPYRDEHCFATAVERMVCAAMGVAWDTYEEMIEEAG